MWYFTWTLGLAAAVSFGIMNAMWLEPRLDDDDQADAQIQPSQRQ
ncbi:cytochrome bd-I oxidase subunit CydX [Bordetella sp. LUAb4]|nr:cytochrome bd-I oxidase subunit CydX [Bordetella sp. LUAb4]